MTAHTPGPWYVSGNDVQSFYRHPVDGSRVTRWIATVSAGRGDTPRLEDHANQRLIAAAPALLEALEAVTNDLVNKLRDQGYAMGIIVEDWAIKKARAAIAQARVGHE